MRIIKKGDFIDDRSINGDWSISVIYLFGSRIIPCGTSNN